MSARPHPAQLFRYASAGLAAVAWALSPLLPAGVSAQAAGQTVASPQPGPGLFLRGTQGPLVVLQAGLGDDHRSWAALVADLSRDHRVVTLDRSGRGGLPASHHAHDPCAQADETRLRLQAAGLMPPYLLVGHSLGGRYAAVQAQRHPQEARGLVLVDATPPGHWARMQAETPGLAAVLKALRATLFDAATRREFDAQDDCMDGLKPVAPAGATVPTVVLASGRRRPEETADFAALLTRGQALWLPLTGAARVEVVNEAGHYIHQDAPDRVAAAVRRLTMPDAAANRAPDAAPGPMPGR